MQGCLLRRSKSRLLMSALGQKQTYAVQNGMSALPPIATSIFSGCPLWGQKADVNKLPTGHSTTYGQGSTVGLQSNVTLMIAILT